MNPGAAARMLLGLDGPPQLPSVGRMPLAIWALTVFGAVVAVLGEFLASFAYLCLFTSLVIVVAGAAAVLLAAFALVRRAYATVARMLAAALIAKLALSLSANVILGTPRWVKQRAQPAIAAVVRYAGNGPYPKHESALTLAPGEVALPKDVERVVHESGCFYSRHEDARTFHITCKGVMFTKCTYDHLTRAWSAWD